MNDELTTRTGRGNERLNWFNGSDNLAPRALIYDSLKAQYSKNRKRWLIGRRGPENCYLVGGEVGSSSSNGSGQCCTFSTSTPLEHDHTAPM